MLSWLRSRNQDADTARELYGRVVAAARNPGFYRDCSVPDTPEGRYEMIVLHMFLLMDRLKDLGEKGKELARATAEAFVEDMDDSMREMGVGDLGVPKKVKRAFAGLYERSALYAKALDAGDAELAAAIGAGIPAVAGSCDSGMQLACSVRRSREHLQGLAPEVILRGAVTFG